MSLIDELRRRHVFRVGGAYVVVAWLLLQVADVLLDNFGAPDWVFKSFTALLLLGFPLAVFLSWAYELTADGLKRAADVTPAVGAAPRSKGLDRAILVGAIAVIAIMAVERVWFAGRDDAAVEAFAAAPEATAAPEAGAPARSIAVLAFDDLSPDGDQAYFAEGISEELLNLLARIDDFKVAARTSSFKYKGSQSDIGEIGRALNVETVLEGSVRKAGDQVRVTAQLIEVDSGYHLWSESYDRRLENIFEVQDEIAGAIVRALRLELDIDAGTATRTANIEAYDHYLRGRQLGREPSRAGLLRAIEEFERAIALDPGFAAAYGGIAEAWTWLEDYGGIKSAEAFPKAEQAARRALALDPQSAEAHAAMAFVRDRYYNDSPGAQALFERTLEINPNYVTAYNLYGDVLSDLGQLDRMIEVHRAAVELDPLSVFMKTRLASKLLILRKYDEVESILAAVLQESPGNDFAREERGNLARERGRLADAVREYHAVHVARPGDPFSAAQIAGIAATMQDNGLAERWIAAARARGEDNRWELSARELMAEWVGDWAAMDRLGVLRSGPYGAYLRGVAAGRSGALPEARMQLLEALQLGGFNAVHGPRVEHLTTLVELAWVEQQLGIQDWADRAAITRPMLEALRGQAVAGSGTFRSNPDEQLARIAALNGDRDAALAHLQGLPEAGYLKHWFLDRDPVFAGWRDDPEFRMIVDRMLEHATAEHAKLAGMDLLP